MSPSAIPTSRAFWELRAEQVMDQVFRPASPGQPEGAPPGHDPDSPIDVLVHEEPERQAPRPASDRDQGRSSGRWRQRSSDWLRRLQHRQRPRLDHLLDTLQGETGRLVGLSGVVCLALGALSLSLWHNWSTARHDLQQERNLLMLERLRTLPPAGETASTRGTAETTPETGGKSRDGLPPPPPSEPWMEELSQLPQGSAPPAEVLQVPISSAIGQPAPPVSGGGGSAGGGLPQLVGVVQVPGRSGSAIFQVGSSSSTAMVGESIGASGWILRSATGDSAVIERSGEQRRVSISSGF